ncbi:MAG: DUF1761 domain-containing protein, partial [Bacteroidia bacterium]
MNILILLAAAVIPMILRFIWYNPKAFGNAWMKASNIPKEKIKSSNMALILIVTFVFSFLLAFILQTIVIHQFSLLGILLATDFLWFYFLLLDWCTYFRHVRDIAGPYEFRIIFISLPMF